MPCKTTEFLHPILKPLCEEFLAKCKAEGIPIGLSCTYRSPLEQNQEYAKGRTTAGPKVTNLKGGQSKHNFLLNRRPASKAFDIYIKNESGSGLNWSISHPHWRRAAEIGKSLGLIWGGDWKQKDGPHFELSPDAETKC